MDDKDTDQDELESAVHSALEDYEASRDSLAQAEANALSHAIENKLRIPKKGELVAYFIEADDSSLMGIVSEVLFAHSATVVTLVTCKHDGVRHTHSNVVKAVDGPQAGRWDFR